MVVDAEGVPVLAVAAERLEESNAPFPATYAAAGPENAEEPNAVAQNPPPCTWVRPIRSPSLVFFFPGRGFRRKPA